MARVLFLGDIIGRPGRNAIKDQLPTIRESYSPDLVVANGENSAGGAGITAAIARELHEAGVDAITLGDHCWDQRGFDKEIDELEFVCRPFNLPLLAPGRRFLVVEAGGLKWAITTALGQQFMKIQSDSPFSAIQEWVRELRELADVVLVEMHAETTSEKVAMGWYLDGMVLAVIGTHTHIPTDDARVLPRGTAYLTDAGMSGPYDSVLGRDIAPIIGKFVDGMPRRFTVAEENVILSGLIVEADPATGLAVDCQRFVWPVEQSS